MSVTKILIANRGEIAERVARTARRMGIPTVAVYSDADRDSVHVRAADEAVHIGPSPVGESYLVVEKIVSAAKRTGADAVHPGYGFLSENADFARRLEAEGLTFIGPSADAIEAMGDKAAAKRAMIAAGVPTVPGYQEDGATDAQLIKAAKSVGYPLMVKAAAGGGGKGMRRVNAVKDLEDAIASARSEGLNSFGSDELILERLVEDARHVEVQVFGDTHGHILHLGERDCSLQRRHQKVIEEAPSPAVSDDLRAAMGAAAVEAARAVDYVGAGTVEFLLGADDAFYFLEMNTRLQVEHPVTELVTGLDLVELQIRVARGEALGLRQGDIALNGHAIEARLYAEDVGGGFLPSSGPIHAFSVPDVARVDTGVEAGSAVSPFYDPMIAKIIVHADTRAGAIAKLERALSDTVVAGPQTNRDFLLELLNTQTFRDGEATTQFIDRHYTEGWSPDAPGAGTFKAAALVSYLARARVPDGVPDELAGWSNMTNLATPVAFRDGEDIHRIGVEDAGDGHYRIHSEDGVQTLTVTRRTSDRVVFEVAPGRSRSVGFARMPDGALHLALPKATHVLRDVAFGEADAEEGAGSGVLRAPMHGLLLDVGVAVGDRVSEGDKLGTLEAMKMQHPLRADVDGEVVEILASAGRQIASGDVVLRIEPDAD